MDRHTAAPVARLAALASTPHPDAALIAAAEEFRSLHDAFALVPEEEMPPRGALAVYIALHCRIGGLRPAALEGWRARVDVACACGTEAWAPSLLHDAQRLLARAEVA